MLENNRVSVSIADLCIRYVLSVASFKTVAGGGKILTPPPLHFKQI